MATVMKSFTRSKRIAQLQSFKSGTIKLPRHWSKMLGLTSVDKASAEEFLQVSLPTKMPITLFVGKC